MYGLGRVSARTSPVSSSTSPRRPWSSPRLFPSLICLVNSNPYLGNPSPQRHSQCADISLPPQREGGGSGPPARLLPL